jgi:hypothetical protein
LANVDEDELIHDGEDDWEAIEPDQTNDQTADDWKDFASSFDDGVNIWEFIDPDQVRENAANDWADIEEDTEDESGDSSSDSDSSDTQSVDDNGGVDRETVSATMNQFSEALDEHLAMLSSWYIAANPDHSATPPSSYQALLSDEFAETVRQLDFSADYDAGGSRPTTWLSWSAVQLYEFRHKTTEIIADHGNDMQPEVTEKLHALVNSRLTKRVITVGEAGIPMNPSLLLSTEGDSESPLTAHLDILHDVLALHEAHGLSSITPIHQQNCWDTDHCPQPGVARANFDTDDDVDNSKDYDIDDWEFIELGQTEEDSDNRRESGEENQNEDNAESDSRHTAAESEVGDNRSLNDNSGVNTGMQTAAMSQFSQALNDHLAMLCSWYIAADSNQPANPPADYHTLFSDEFTETVQQLDFSTGYDARSSTSATWLSWSSIRLKEFRRETMEIIADHDDNMQPEVTEKLHALVNSRLIKNVITAEEADLPTDTEMLLFAKGDSDDPLTAHLDTLRDILSRDEIQSSLSVTPIDEQDCWDTDRYPRPGAAQADSDSDDL